MVDERIERFRKLAHETLRQYGPDADNADFGRSHDWLVSFGSLSPESMGMTNLTYKRIVINIEHRYHVFDEVLRDTVLHEVAHALAGRSISKGGRRMFHGALWKKWAKRIGAAPLAVGVRTPEMLRIVK